MPTEKQLHDAMQGYLDALNRADVEAITALFSDGATIEDPVGTGIHPAAEGLARLVGALPEGSTFTLDSRSGPHTRTGRPWPSPCAPKWTALRW